MNYKAAKIRITCDMSRVNDWADFMKSNMDEVCLSLRQESVRHEMWFCGTDAEGLYLIGVMDCDDFDHASKTAKQSQLSVDQKHKEFKQFWTKREELPIDPSVEPDFSDSALLLDIRP